DQVRSPADGLFNGVLCNSPGQCNANARSTGIAEQNKVILSGSTPIVTLADGSPLPASIAIGGTNSAASLSFWVRDVNGNVMPGGTTVQLSSSGAGLSVTQPNSFE